MSDSTADFAVAIVTHQSAGDLPACLAVVAALRPAPAELVIVDCASTDGSAAVARESAAAAGLAVRLPVRVLALAENLGFAGGMNRALAESRSPWVLTLNADALPAPDYVARLLERRARHPELRVGALTGRLLRSAQPRAPALADTAGTADTLDAAGMRLTLTWRHLDRGAGEPDRGQLRRAERVFGATGAASLWNRDALVDVAIDGEVFDSAFHSFREDAELCFRLRERGWEVLYEPAAAARHRRFSLPERRRAMPAAVNLHSLKNRYLLRAYHQTAWNFAWTLLPALGRDLMALAWVLAAERSSLGAYRWLWRHRREIAGRRRTIQGRRTAPALALDRWFLRDRAPL